MYSPWKFTWPLACLIAVATLFLAGCKTTYEMQVDAIKNPDSNIQGESYVIVPGDPEIDTSDLRYQETVKWVKTALSSKGLYEAISLEEADMIIQLDYGMEAPRQEYKVVQDPVYANVRGPDRFETVTYTDNSGATKTYTTRVPGDIRRELVGYQERVIAITIIEKRLVLTAVDNVVLEDSDAPPTQLWSVYVVNEDDGDDLREYLPIMAAAAADNIGEDTGKMQKVKLKEDDEVVTFIKQGLKSHVPSESDTPSISPEPVE